MFFEIRGTIKKQIDVGIYKLILADIDVFLRISNNLALGKNKFKIHNSFRQGYLYIRKSNAINSIFSAIIMA